jgi:hypothetical protein
VKDLVQRHRTGGENHDERLWALVNFEMWQRRFFDGDDKGKVELPTAREAELAPAHA